jgi:hypothetical protein
MRPCSSSDALPRNRKHTTLKGRGDAFVAIASIDPVAEEAREAHVFSETRAQPRRAEMAKDHPQLQRAEPAAELDARVHQVPDAGVPLARLEIFGDE